MEVLNTYIFHWLPEKGIWIGGHTLSWDARCSGIYIGFGIGVLYHLAAGRRTKNLPPPLILFATTLLLLPLFFDVSAIKWLGRVPSNDVRYLTGLFFGAAFSIYIYPVFVMLTSSRLYDCSAIGNFTRFMTINGLVVCAFYLKSFDNIVVFAVLEGLAVMGFLSLAGLLSLSVFSMTFKTLITKGGRVRS